MLAEQLVLAMGRFATGDDAAFADVYDLASPRIYRFVLHLCRDQSVADDLTQDTFLRLHRARGIYRRGSPVLPWAYTIARRLFLDSVRARKSEAKTQDHRVNEQVRLAAHGLDHHGSLPDQLLVEAELKQQLERAMATLPEPQASALHLLKAEGLSVAEAAAILGVTQGAVKLRAHRAYETLRNLLGNGLDDALAVPAAEGVR